MADVDTMGEVPTSSPHFIRIDSSSSLASASSTSDPLEFKCQDIENFLNFFQPESDMVKMESDACAIPPDASSSCPLASSESFLSPAQSNEDSSFTPVIREFELPKSISIFNCRLYTASSPNKTIVKMFDSKPTIDINEIQESRFPPALFSCYGVEVTPPTPCGTRAGPDSTEPRDEKAGAPSAQVKGRRKRRKRFSLLEVKKFHNGRERELLVPDAEDLKSAIAKTLPGRGIPFIYPCTLGEKKGCGSECAQNAHNFKLYMSVGPNNGILPPPIVTENILSNLRHDLTVVDETSALIATTALRAKNQPNFRIFLPVSDNILQRIPVARDIQMSPVFDIKLEIDDSVRSVVSELVEFVDRQSIVIKPDYDPDYHELSFDSSFNDDSTNWSVSNMETSDDPSRTSTPEITNRKKNRRFGKTDRVIRELKKLANISVADESSGDTFELVKKSENCTELYCKLGCVCDSLSIKPPPADHCGNSDCIFGCVCGERQRYVYVPIEELAKNEKSWHQTVVRKADNCVEIQSGIARSKRAKKAPERFDDWNPGPGRGSRARTKRAEEKKPVANKKPEKTEGPDVSKKIRPQNKNLFKGQDVNRHQNKVSKLLEIIKNKPELGEATELDERTIRKLSLSKKLVYCRTAGKSAKSLADVFIYCSIHNVYDCECDGWIVMLKNSDMLLKSAFKQTKMMEEALKTISLSIPSTFRKKAILYDLARHSARTADPVIDYVKRNRTKVFRKKTSIALEYGIPSYTNSYIKVPPVPLMSYCEDEVRDSNPSFLGTDAVQSGVGRVVKLSFKSSSENEKFKVVDDLTADCGVPPPAPAIDLPQVVDSDSDELPEGKFTIAEPPSKRPRVGRKLANKKPPSASCLKPVKLKPALQKQNNSEMVIDLCRDDSPVERQPDSSIIISDDDEDEDKLPDFGLFCQSHPHLGYVALEDRGKGFFSVRGFSEQIDKLSFVEIKQACEFLKQILDHTGDPKYANSKWIKVTKGVLELKKCQRFVPSQFLRSVHDLPHMKKKVSRARKIRGFPPLSPIRDNVLSSVDLTDDNLSAEKPEAPLNPALGGAVVTSTTQTSQVVSAGMMPILVTKTTFPSMDEAKAYIQKNFAALSSNSTPEQLSQQLVQQQPLKQLQMMQTLQPVTSMLQQLPKQLQQSAQNLPPQRLVVPTGSTCVIRQTPPSQPMARIALMPGVAATAPQSLQAATASPSITQIATSVPKTSASVVATPKSLSSAIVTFRNRLAQKLPQLSEPPRSADVILPLNERTIKILSPQPKSVMATQPCPEKTTPVAYLYNKKNLPTSPVKSLLANRKLDDR